jgi:squalene-hopene/tetraprenyl-beta-curcumene cyclase
MQPDSGGYLEATPLTAFVVSSLIGSGNAHDPIVERGIRFLTGSARADGSWPIDTNLATWVTTLAVGALAPDALTKSDGKHLVEWLLQQQVGHEHPFTRAKPGGWAWTDLTGGVPDADDTAGALVTLRRLAGDAHVDAAARGIHWLLNLQNRDGGVPTFCRGWGALPFDRSAPDLTAHAVEAWSAWFPAMTPQIQTRISTASRKAVSYLARTQKPDGSWLPLWFGSEQMPGQVNPTYGTARVIAALAVPLVQDQKPAAAIRQIGLRWLLRTQNRDGGWGAGGTPSSIEETGAALHALAGVPRSDASDAVVRGSHWLISATAEGKSTPATPIGLYFARLWYYEELYPLVFALRGLSAGRGVLHATTPWSVRV